MQDDHTGILVAGIGNGFSISVRAKTSESRLAIHVGGWKSSGRFLADLTDRSSAPFEETTEYVDA